MDLSIIILTLNNRKILEACLKSIREYTRSISYELIVIDNGSSDGTQALIRARYPDAVLIENRKNLGFTRANNKGLKAAKGRYALILNDDTYIREDAFSRVVDFMDGNTDIGICGPKLLNADGSLQHQGSMLSAWRWKAAKPVDVPFVIGACMFIRASILKKIGLFDENLFFYNDDLDICKSAVKAGYRVVYYPEASVFHYGGVGSKKKRSWFFFVEGIRSGLYFCRKHYSPFIYSLYRIFVIVAASLMAVISLITYPFGKERLRSYLQILRICVKEEIIGREGA